MKKIEVIIKPFKLEAVKEALGELGIVGMTVSEVKGSGRRRDATESYPPGEPGMDFLPRIKVEVVLASERTGQTVAAIVKAAKSEGGGAGKIFVLPIMEAVRIRTGERGENAVAG